MPRIPLGFLLFEAHHARARDHTSRTHQVPTRPHGVRGVRPRPQAVRQHGDENRVPNRGTGGGRTSHFMRRTVHPTPQGERTGGRTLRRHPPSRWMEGGPNPTNSGLFSGGRRRFTVFVVTGEPERSEWRRRKGVALAVGLRGWETVSAQSFSVRCAPLLSFAPGEYITLLGGVTFFCGERALCPSFCLGARPVPISSDLPVNGAAQDFSWTRRVSRGT